MNNFRTNNMQSKSSWSQNDPKEWEIVHKDNKMLCFSLWSLYDARCISCIYVYGASYIYVYKFRIILQQKKYSSNQTISVWDASVSGHHGSPIEGLPETPRTITTLSNWGVQGCPLLSSSLCRETLFSRTADVKFCKHISPTHFK